MSARSAFAALALLAALPGAVEAQKVVTEVPVEEMSRIVRSMGFDVAVEGDDDDQYLVFELGGHKTLLFLLNDDTDGQLYAGFIRDGVSMAKLNTWNTEHRFGRAYLDSDDDPVLESDLDFAGGVTEDAIKAWIRVYRDLLVRYAVFIDE